MLYLHDRTVYRDMHFKDLVGYIARVGCRIPVPDFYLELHRPMTFDVEKHYTGFNRYICMRQGMLTLSGAPSTTSHLDINILSILHHLGSPLG